MYFIDSEEATEIRCEMNKECDSELMDYLDKFIREHNKFAKSYQLMKEVYSEQEELAKNLGYEMPNVKLLFSLKDNYDHRRYNLPQSNEVCAIMVCDANDDIPPARIVVYPKGQKELKDIYPLDKCVDPMCYPILYPTATKGYDYMIKDKIGKKISLL